MKNLAGKILLTLFGLVFSVMVMGQADGDYQTRNSGNWNSNATWRVRSGGSWVNCGPGDYPGATAGAGTVNIRNGHTVTVTAAVPNSVAALRIANGDQNSFVQFTSTGFLRVTGQTVLRSDTDYGYKAVLVDEGAFRTGSVRAVSNGDNRDAGIRISSGEVTVDGDIALNGTSQATYILFTGDGKLYVGGEITGGNITSDNGGGNNPPTSGTVIYNGTAAQDIGEYEYYNLSVDNSSGVSLTQDITVNNTLTMTSGNITTGTHTLIVDGNTPGNLVHSSGAIIGNLRRAAATTGSDYLFPVGTSSNYNPLTINFTNLTSGSLTVSFQPFNPGTGGLPLDDDGLEIDDTFSAGYWLMSASGGLASTNYDLTLNATGFGGLTDLSRIVSGLSNGTLFLSGDHGSVSDPEITRTAMNGIPFGVAIGKGVGGFITQPSDYTGCDPSFTVVPGGTAPFTYQWQVDEGSGFTNISNNAIYSGATSATLTIPGATEAMTGYTYRCVVTDANSNVITSNGATLTFNLPDVYFGYRYSMELTIDPASGGADLTDFPVLVDLSSTLLRSESNGGHVANTNGYDIIFTAADGSRLYSQAENYNPATGSLTAWVRIPLLSASSTTTINILYGNNSITTDQSSNQVWTTNYKGVWHLNGSDYSDGTSNSNDGTQSNTSSVTGIIAGARGFNGSTSHIQVPTNNFVPNDNNQTISVWARYSSTPSGTSNLITFQNTGAASAIQLGFRNGRVVAWKWGGQELVNAGLPPSANTWHYFVYTFNGTTSRLYVDGVEQANSTVAPQTAMPAEGNIGRYNNGEYFNGYIDEPRFSILPRSAGWILTEYNNQNNPSSFVTMGSESDNNLLTTIGAWSTSFPLSQGYPSGGVHSGTGVSGSNFNASLAGVGTHTITYTYTDGDGCSNSDSKNIIVTPEPAPPAASDVECCISNIFDLEATGTYLTWYSDAALTTEVGTGTPFATGRTAAGTYTYYVTQTVNGWESAATTVTLSIYNDITINTHPQPVAVCDGDNAQFTVAASGYNLTYQWRENGNPISDGARFSGATTATLTVIDPGMAGSGRVYSVRITSTCGTAVTSSGAALTVTPQPVATFSYPGSPYCPNGTNPLPQFSGGGVAGTFSSTAGLVFVSTSTGQINLSASTPGLYTVTNTISPSGGCGEVSATADVRIISDLVWTGAGGAAWNNSANWLCGLVPGASTSVTIPITANNPIVGAGETATAGNLVIESGASLDVGSGEIRISGTITNDGTFIADQGTVVMCGTSAQEIGAGTFSGNTVNNLETDNAAGVTLLGQLDITGMVTVTSGNLASFGFLTLVSTSLQTALINGSGAGTVTGYVTMQRYLPSAFGYKYFSSPFTSATVSEFGDNMDLAAAFPTFYRYDESRTASGWVNYTNPTGILEPMRGYSVNFGTVALPGMADVTGEVNSGLISLNLLNHNHTYTKGFHLVGNPYPSPINWDSHPGWNRVNIDDALYFFKASTTDSYGGSYSTYIEGISSDGTASPIIPSMQGFFIHVSDGAYPVTGTLSIDNDARTTSLSPTFFKSATKGDRSLLRIDLMYDGDTLSADPMVIYSDTKATLEFDGSLDALKLFNTDFNTPNLYALSESGRTLSIYALPVNEESATVVPLGVTLYKPGDVKFRLRNIEGYFGDYGVILSDQTAGIQHNLVAGNDYVVSLPQGVHNNRFFLNVGGQATTAGNLTGDDGLFTVYAAGGVIKADIKRVTGNNGILRITSLTGRVILNEKIYSPGRYEFITGVNDGFIIVTYITGNRISSKKIIISGQ